MEISDTWEKTEKMIEEHFGYSMREMREKRDNIQSLEDKYSTKTILGKSCFEDIVNEIIEEPLSKIMLSEWCIKRNQELKRLDFDNLYKKGCISKVDSKKLKKEVKQAEILWNIIQYSILPLEVFWSMEYQANEGVSFSKKETEIFEYMQKIGELYIDKTEKIITYLPIFEGKSLVVY